MEHRPPNTAAFPLKRGGWWGSIRNRRFGHSGPFKLNLNSFWLEMPLAGEVQKVVKAVMPQHVMVELCDARRGRLEAQRAKPESCSILPGRRGSHGFPAIL